MSKKPSDSIEKPIPSILGLSKDQGQAISAEAVQSEEPRSTPGKELTITEGEKRTPASRMRDVSPEILPSESSTSSDLLSEAISDTVNYADNCMSELLEQMKELGESENNPFEKVQTTSVAARSFAEVIRAKIEALQLLKKND